MDKDNSSKTDPKQEEPAEEQESELENGSDEETPFREGAVDRLSSPEQLDRVMVVVKPKGWVALLCFAGIILSLLIWSFLGHIPIEVEGKGIILTQEGLFSIYSTTSGLVAEVPIKLGDWVTPETVVAKIYDQALMDQIKAQEVKLALLNANIAAAKTQKDEKNLSALEADLEMETVLLKELKEKNLIINVYSQAVGKIIENDVAEGTIVNFGTPLAWAHHPLEEGELPVCHAYFPVKEGEQIAPSMKVKMSLENIDTQTYGYMLGEVFSVSEFPVSDQDLYQVLRSPQLISYMKQGAPTVMSVLIHPIADKMDPSGYQWTSEQGPNSYIKIGSICDVKIVTEDKRPISYLFPFWFTPSQEEPLGSNPNVFPGKMGRK